MKLFALFFRGLHERNFTSQHAAVHHYIYGNEERDSGAEGMNYIGTKRNNYSKMVTQFQFMSGFLDRDLIFFFFFLRFSHRF